MNISVIGRLIPDDLASFSNHSTSMNRTVYKQVSITLLFSLLTVNFKSIPIIMVVTKYVRRIYCFMIKPSFFTPLKISPLARSIPAPKVTNLTRPTVTLVLTCNTALLWWPQKLNDVSDVRVCADGGISRHFLRPWRKFSLFY